MTKDTKKVYIKNFGCQMNEHDSERVKDLLLRDGYSLAEDANDADVVLVNTCSVRKHAEERVFGLGSVFENLKKRKKSVIVGIIGCMAEAERDEIFRKMPSVDFLCGPADLDRVPEIIDKIRNGAGHIIHLGGYRSKRIPEFSELRSSEKRAYVKIMEGCDNYCSYCIVPYVRGPERSRLSKEILKEIKALISQGVEEITLLGQNVNSYGRGLKEKINFVGLLRKIDKMIKRDCFVPTPLVLGLAMTPWGKNVIVNFITSHPKDAGIDLFNVMVELKPLSKNLHLPMQSGSNKILKKMNRGYTIEHYKKLIEDFRKIVKGAGLTTDIIAGFPGESEKDFQDTVKAVKEIQFDAAYIFKYSPRPFTKAAKFKDDVPKEEKERRHQVLLELQKEISRKKR
jgi:tRNA-2-methylthio-N6-dimethylallyladenosine synthase